MKLFLLIACMAMQIDRSTADKLYSGGRYDEAAQQYQQLIAKTPGDPSLYTLLGDCQYRLGHYEDSLKSFQQALAVKPELPPAFVGQAKSLIALGRSKEAIPYLSKAMQLNPFDREVQRAMAHALEQLNQFPQAEKMLKHLVQLDPRDGESLFYLGELLYRNGYYGGALPPLENGLRAGFINFQAQIYHAIALFKVGRTLQAESEFLGLSSLSEALHDPDFLLVYAELLDETGRPEEALKRTDQAVAVTPNSPMAHFWRARMLLRLGRLKEAAPAAEKAVQLAPQLPFAHNLLVQIYHRQGRLEDAAREAAWLREYQNRIRQDRQL